MKNIFSQFVFLFLTVVVSAQKEITLEAIWSGEFRSEYLSEIHSMNDPDVYSVFKYDRATRETRIDVHSFTDKNKISTLLSAKDLPIQYFENYSFSKNENLILLGAQMQPIYRYTSSGLFFVYNRNTKKLIQVFDKPIINPQFSPDGTKVAYVFENNLYYLNIASAEVIQVTNDGENNAIINGLADWVYEEEFELTTAFKWSPDSKQLAFLKLDESAVKEFDMTIYGSGNYTNAQTFKYPKAGEENSKVDLYNYNIASSKNTKIDLSNYQNYYLPKLQWTTKNNLVVMAMNRHQNHMQLVKINTLSYNTDLFYEEKNTAYVEYDNHLTFLKDDSFLLTSEKSGFNHLHYFSESGKQIKQITKGDYTVTDVYGFNADNNKIYYQSTEGNTTERQLFEIGLKGTKKRALTTKKGQHVAHFNTDYSLYVDDYSSAKNPSLYSVRKTETNDEVLIINDNKRLQEKLQSYQLTEKEFSTVNINGYDLNTWILKPTDFDETKKYPVLLYQYSGPNSQTVSNVWNSYDDYWHQLLVQKGYIVACVDGRGTGFKGEKFKTLTQNQLGKLETEDQIAFAENLVKLPYIDSERIGIWGWSYGGTTALNAILKGNNIFSTAISVAPVTNWRFYDTIYTERFMTTPSENTSGYDDYSPLSYPELLKGNLLLVHGTADDNVHVQNTLKMAEAFTNANKQFDLAVYTDKNHGIYGGNTRLHLYTKMTNFILKNL